MKNEEYVPTNEIHKITTVKELYQIATLDNLSLLMGDLEHSIRIMLQINQQLDETMETNGKEAGKLILSEFTWKDDGIVSAPKIIVRSPDSEEELHFELVNDTTDIEWRYDLKVDNLFTNYGGYLWIIDEFNESDDAMWLSKFSPDGLLEMWVKELPYTDGKSYQTLANELIYIDLKEK